MGANSSRSRENNPRPSAVSAEPPATAPRKKTKKENRQESRAAQIARFEAEAPITFWFSVDPNSSERLENFEISCEQDFDDVVHKMSWMRLDLKDKTTHRRLKSILNYTDAVKTIKGLPANQYLFLHDPIATLANEVHFEKNYSFGIELQSNLAVTSDQELRHALGGSHLTFFNEKQPVLFWRYKKDPDTEERQTSTAGDEIKEKFLEADGLGVNDTKLVFIESKACVIGEHICALGSERLNTLLRLLRGLVVEPQFYESEPPEIKGELIEILNNKFAGQFTDPELHLQPVDRLPIALVLSGHTFTAEMQRWCYEKDPTLPPTLPPTPTLTPTPTPTLDQPSAPPTLTRCHVWGILAMVPNGGYKYTPPESPTSTTSSSSDAGPSSSDS